MEERMKIAELNEKGVQAAAARAVTERAAKKAEHAARYA